MCSPWLPEAHFWKPTLSNQPSKIHFLDPWIPKIRDRWAIFLALIALLPVRFACFRLQPPIRILIFAGKNVYFLLMGPLGNLRLALLVLSNVFYMTFSSFRIDLCIILWKMLPDFANFKKCAPRPRWEAHFRRTIFASIVCKTMFPYPNLLQKVWFLMLVGIFFLHLFAFFMKMCSPPSVGSTFSKNDFYNYRVQEDVSIPNLASKPPLMGGHFRIVLCKK